MADINGRGVDSDKRPDSQSNGGIMDVQPPTPGAVSPQAAVTSTPSSWQPPGPPYAGAPSSPAGLPPSDNPSAGTDETQPVANQQGGDQAVDGQTAPAQTSPASDVKTSHHAPVAAVILALIIGGALSGLVILAYFKSRPKPTPRTTAPAASSKLPASKVDEAVKDVDSSLNKAVAADPTAINLSDQALGL